MTPKPKNIPDPQFQSARKLTPMELNTIKCHNKHTVLTPDILKNPPK